MPIYESDEAKERWQKTEWNHYELWEKVEVRLRRHKRLWILSTVAVFLALSSVPIVIEQRPKWAAMNAARLLGQEVNRIKREAGINRTPYRLRFHADGSLAYDIEQLKQCSDSQGAVVRSGSLQRDPRNPDLALIQPARGRELGVPGLVDSICFDPLAGSEPVTRGETAVGFALIPVNDLTEGRPDRMSILLLTGPSAEVSFD